MNKITNVWVTTDKATNGSRNFIGVTIFRSGGGSRSYNCHSERSKKRRFRYLWRALRLQAAFMSKGD